MNKNLVAASAVVLGLALSGVACAGGPVVSHSYNQSGLGLGVVNDSALNDMGSYDVNFSFLTASWEVGMQFGGYNNDADGLSLGVSPYFHMIQALSSRWSLIYGVGGNYVYYSDLVKAGKADKTQVVPGTAYLASPWSVSAQVGVAYALSSNVRMSVIDNVFTYQTDTAKKTLMGFIDSPALSLTYYFS